MNRIIAVGISLVFIINFIPIATSSIVGDVGLPPINYELSFRQLLENASYKCYQRTNVNWVLYPGLEVIYRNISNAEKKFTLKFNSTNYYADYKIFIILDNCTRYYYMPENKAFWLDFTDYTVTFSYKDISNLQNLKFDHYFDNLSSFWFSIERDHIRNINVVLDPNYTVGIGGSSATNFPGGHKLVRFTNGTLLCVYLNTAGSRISYSISFDEGVTWYQSNITSFAFNTNYPAIAVNSTNFVSVVYAKSVGIGYRTYNPSTAAWSDETLIANDVPDTALYPSIAIDSNDEVYVAWTQVIYSHHFNIRFQKLNSSGWSRAFNITQGSAYNYTRPNIILDFDDKCYVFYTYATNTGTTLYVQNKSVYTDTWNASVYISSILGTLANPVGAVNKTNCIGVVFSTLKTSLPYNRAIIFASSLDYGDTWNTYSIISTTLSAPNFTTPTITIDNDSTVHVAFMSVPSDVRNRYVRYAFSTDFGVTWDTDIYLIVMTSIIPISPSMIWSLTPCINCNRYDVPLFGFNFIWTNSTSGLVFYYNSSDINCNLTWGTFQCPTPTLLEVLWKWIVNDKVNILPFCSLFILPFIFVIKRRRKKNV